jgi:Arc/MetJ-type ribon-helix-helix transcriptional regulator
MSQINLHTTPEFERDLDILMRTRGMKNKSEAIRCAVREAAASVQPTDASSDWHALRGFVHRLPGGWQSDKTSRQILDQLDQEMDEELERLGGTAGNGQR